MQKRLVIERLGDCLIGADAARGSFFVAIGRHNDDGKGAARLRLAHLLDDSAPSMCGMERSVMIRSGQSR